MLQRGGKGAGILVDLRAGPAWATGRSLGKENRNIQKPCPRTPLGDPVLGHPPDSAHQPPQPGPDLFLQSHQLSLARPPPDLRKDAGGRLPLGVRLPEMRKGVSTASGKDEAPPRSPPPGMAQSEGRPGPWVRPAGFLYQLGSYLPPQHRGFDGFPRVWVPCCPRRAQSAWGLHGCGRMEETRPCNAGLLSVRRETPFPKF